MQANRSRDTKPELEIRRRLHELGLRYRVAIAPEPGLRRRADIVFTRARVAVFTVKSTEVVYRLVILRLLGQAVRAGSSGWATTSSGVCGSPTRRAAARASSPR